MFEKMRIISLSADHITFSEALDKVMEWGLRHEPSYVCFANVHMVIEAYKDNSFLKKVNAASLVVTDGKPLAIACRLLYGKKQDRISGMDFMPQILAAADRVKANVFLYGSSMTVLEALKKKIIESYPGVIVGGAISPPYRELQADEINTHIEQINNSGANMVLVALGCPKQEKWMSANYDKIRAVLLGVGGAFPVVAGIQQRSPKWMQRWALEWLYRLFQEPGRMFKRYFYTNSYFLLLLAKEWIKKQRA